MLLTYRYRIRDGSRSDRNALRAQARAVNYVWNYCCQIDREAQARWKSGSNIRRPRAFDLTSLCRGATKELGIHSDTIDAICKRFADARDQVFPKTPRYRSAKRCLDWIPFSNFNRPVKLRGDRLTILGRDYRLWMSRPLPEAGRPKNIALSVDARGRWYANIAVEIDDVEQRLVTSEVGIDLGLKTLATLSNGDKIEMPAFYRKAEARLALHQQRKQKKRARALAAKVANQRKDFLHKASTKLVKEYDRIVVGDVSPSKLKRTTLARSVGDAGWAMLRSMLQYKSIATGAICEIVSERHSSATCSACNARSGPKGIAGLRIREWMCESCGVVHDRDSNAALNILLGAERRPLVEGTLALSG